MQVVARLSRSRACAGYRAMLVQERSFVSRKRVRRAVGGTLLRGLLRDPMRQRLFNLAMALLLVASLYPILEG